MSDILSGIECIGVVPPSFLQTAGGNHIIASVDFGEEDDVLEAHVTTTGNAPVTGVSDPKWFKADSISTGVTGEDTNQELWFRIIEAGEESPFAPTFTFATDAGEKSIGIQGWRYCDIGSLIAAILGSTDGEPVTLAAAFNYSYSNVWPKEGLYGYAHLEELVTSGDSSAHLDEAVSTGDGSALTDESASPGDGFAHADENVT